VWAEGGRSARILVDGPGRTINFSTHGATGRIKIGDAPVQDFHLQKGESGDYSWGGNFNANIAKKILSHSGELKVEIPIYRTGPEIFKFTIEQDNITKSMPKAEPKKVEPKSSQDNIGQEPSQSAGYSASYSGRVAARIKSNITWAGQDEVSQKAEVKVRVSPDGTIIDRRLIKSSGNRAWDESVLRAIDKAEVLPRDVDGRVPAEIVLSFNP
jgi:TonB family protein